MSGFDSWVLSYLLNSLWQIPLLFAAGWAAARVMRQLGPGAEHRVWVGTLLLQALLPASSTLPLGWWQALFSWLGGGRQTGGGRVSVVMGAGTTVGRLHLPVDALAVVVFAYGAATAYLAARFVWRCGQLRVMRRESAGIELAGGVSVHWSECLQRFGLDEVSIAASALVRGPVTMGLRRKLLLLPVDMAASLPEAELRAVIAHEFAHMRRNDFLKNLIYEALSLPIGYHPVLRFTRERLMQSREIVCDEIAAQFGGRNAYAKSLLRLASLLVNGTPIGTPHAIGIFDANAFERRLMKLTEKQGNVHGARRVAIILLCSAIGAAACASSLALGLRADAAGTGNKPGAAGAPLTVPAGVMAGNVLSKVAPKYPAEAKEQRIQGTVVLSAVINKEGNIEKLTVVSGPKELQQSSLDAVRQWTYKPYLLNGDPVEVETTIHVVYSLAK